ncbi:MAG: ATP-binding cassette domain-containing protein [Bacillota bacterium]
MIEAKGVSLRYADGTLALNNIFLQVDPGELVYITGPSGSGKTSLLKLLMGMEYPSEGTLHVLNQAISKSALLEIRALRRTIGPVFQDFNLIYGRSSLENVMLGMRVLGIHPSQMKNDAKSALVTVGLEHKIFSLVENLSWGERQRVAIARTIARRPKLILADEPTGNLDKDNALKILSLLASFRNKNTSVIITTHATHLIDQKQSFRCIQLNKGSISQDKRECYIN